MTSEKEYALSGELLNLLFKYEKEIDVLVLGRFLISYGVSSLAHYSPSDNDCKKAIQEAVHAGLEEHRDYKQHMKEEKERK